MERRLEGKRALVTGGSRGIGAAIVERLAHEGAHVALAYVSRPDQAGATARAAQALGVRALAIQADSAYAEQVLDAVDRTARELGGLDILVDNAGVAALAPIDEFRIEDLDRTLAVNLRAAFDATQAAVRHMKAGGRVLTPPRTPASASPRARGRPASRSSAARGA